MIKIDLSDIKDDRKFKDLALLFDNPDFQKEIEKLIEQNKEDRISHPDLTSYLINPDPTAYEMARDLIKKYKYPLGFTRAVFTGATSGKVSDDDVINCYSRILMSPMSEMDIYTPNLTREDLVIFIDPQSIKRNKQAIMRDIGLLLDGVKWTTFPLPKNHPITKDVGKKFRRIRDWYWLNNDGKGYKKLSQELRIKQETIRSGIRYYKRLLTYRV